MLPGGSLLEYTSSQTGQLSVGFSYEHEKLDSPIYGSDPIPNYNRERTDNRNLTLVLNYGITDHFSFSGFLPYRYILNEKLLFRGQNKNQYFGGKYYRESSGLGDIILQGRVKIDPFNGNFPFIVGVGLKLSNGPINSVDMYGERISDNLQVGTGTTDPIVSIFTSETLSSFLVSGGVFMRISNGENIYGYQYGNELQALINLDYLHHPLLYGGLQMNYLLTTRDYYEYGKVARDRGGESLFGAIKLGTRVTPIIDTELVFQFPISQNLNESQLTSPHLLQLGFLIKVPS